MTDTYVADYERERARLIEANGGYDITAQHDACGVGLVCAIDGKPRREVVELAIRALKAIWHRGAVDADGNLAAAYTIVGFNRKTSKPAAAPGWHVERDERFGLIARCGQL